MPYLLLLLLALATPALSEPLSAITADLTGDGIAERAELVEIAGGGDADLLIYIGQPGGGQVLAVTAPALVWVGGIGQQPGLAVTERGSLQVLSMNESIGRDRWQQTLTLAWRNGAFMLAGFTYSWYDTLDLANSGTCDVNLLNGKGNLEKGREENRTRTTFRTDMRAVPIADWAGDIPRECGLW